MADSKEKLDITNLEEMMRRNMPMLDVPESLSAEAVARHLEENTKIRRTPLYIFVRTAVAAVLTMAIGIGAVYTVKMTHRKETREDSSVPEAEYYTADGEYSKTEDNSRQDYDVLDGSGQKEGEPADTSEEAFNYSADVSETVTIHLRTGEESTTSTDLSYTDSMKLSRSPEETEQSSDTEICSAEVINNSSGTAEIHVKGLSEGYMVLVLSDGEDVILNVEITVTD